MSKSVHQNNYSFYLVDLKPLALLQCDFLYDFIGKQAKTYKLGQFLNSLFLKPLGGLLKQGVQKLTLMKASSSSNAGWTQCPCAVSQTSDRPCRFCSTPGHSSSTTQTCTEVEDTSCACSHHFFLLEYGSWGKAWLFS